MRCHDSLCRRSRSSTSFVAFLYCTYVYYVTPKKPCLAPYKGRVMPQWRLAGGTMEGQSGCARARGSIKKKEGEQHPMALGQGAAPSAMHAPRARHPSTPPTTA